MQQVLFNGELEIRRLKIDSEEPDSQRWHLVEGTNSTTKNYVNEDSCFISQPVREEQTNFQTSLRKYPRG